VANPLGIFSSRLAPEEKRFIKRVGVSLFALILISEVLLYFYTKYEMKDNVMEQAKETETLDETKIEVFDSDTIEDIEPPSLHNFSEPATQATSAKTSTMYEIARLFLENPKLAARLGHLLLEAGYTDEAVSVLQNGVPPDLASVPVLVDLAYGHFYSKNFETALSELDTALGKYPDNADLLTAKAAITGLQPDTNQRSKAEDMFKAILKKNSKSAEANYQYGRYIMQIGDFKKSKEYLEKAVNSEPYNPRYIARLGMAEFYLKQDSKAEELYKQALKINPYDYNTWYNLGELYFSQANESSNANAFKQKIRDAMESYLKTLENDSLHANAHFRIGVILNGNSNYKEAIKHLSITLEKIPRNIPSMQQLSSAYLKLGDTTKSINYLNEILEIDPFNKIAASELKRLNK